ncbi:MAG: class I SAM-dependent methyltransferase [Dokdonella sp.]
MTDEAAALEARLEQSWRTNAFAWTRAVREERIASRRAGTDAAIIDAVLQTRATRVLDVGCGEGWLARALALAGCDVVGIDASPELVAEASELGGARFEVVTYAQLSARTPEFGSFDTVVCNFALLSEDLQTPLRALHGLLRDGGKLIVQTVHPWIACGDAPYVNGWRNETFADFGADFRAAMPWYFRTLAAWATTIHAAGFRIERWLEPLDAASGRPLSLLLHAVPTTAESTTG